MPSPRCGIGKAGELLFPASQWDMEVDEGDKSQGQEARWCTPLSGSEDPESHRLALLTRPPLLGGM